MSNLINVSGELEFKKEVLESEGAILVDFWAPWCGPCQMMVPVLEDLAKEFGDKLKIVKVDTEVPANQNVARQYQIQSIPNMKLFKKGEVVQDFIGYRPKEVISGELKPWVE